MDKREEEFWRRIGVEPPDDERGDMGRMGAMEALRTVVEMCATIHKSALNAGFSDEQAFEMVMGYYSFFLTSNLVDQHSRGRDG